MAKRNVNRNGRGQIVSYELNSGSYGEVLLSNVDFQNVEKYNRLSFQANVDFKIVEFSQNKFVLSGFNNQTATPASAVSTNIINSDILIDPMIDLGFVLFTVQL
jgi:hypothetical protein